MIIGNGMIARKFYPEFASDPEILVFASGVSDSKQENELVFLREEDLLRNSVERYPHLKLVYFSTCSIYDPSLGNTPYIRHKVKMEKLIHEITGRYLICRTTNLVGKTTNTNTIINFLVEKISNNSQFVCWNGAFRNILDVEDFYRIVKEILFKLQPEERKTVNIFNPISHSILKIINAVEQHLSVKARFTEEKKGSSFKIPGLEYIMPVYERLGLKFEDDYLDRVLTLYFPVSVHSSKEIEI